MASVADGDRLGTLTDRQREVFDFIVAFIREHGYPPSVRDIAEHDGCRIHAIHGVLVALRKKGWIDWQKTTGGGRSRTLRILIGETCHCCNGLGRILPGDTGRERA